MSEWKHLPTIPNGEAVLPSEVRRDAQPVKKPKVFRSGRPTKTLRVSYLRRSTTARMVSERAERDGGLHILRI